MLKQANQTFRRLIRQNGLSALFVSFFLLCGPVQADQANQAGIDSLQQSLKVLQIKFESFQRNEPTGKVSDIDDFNQQLAHLNDEIETCINTNTGLLENSKKSLKLLGESQTGEAKEIRTKRDELIKKSDAIDNQLKRCSVLKIQLEQLQKNTEKLRQVILKRQFFSREFSLFATLSRLMQLDEKTLSSELNAIQPLSERVFNSARWPLLITGFIGLLAGFLLQWMMRHITSRESVFSSKHLESSLRGIQRTLPAIIAMLFIWLYLSFEDTSQSFATTLSTNVASRVILYCLLLITLYGLLRGVLFPLNNASHISNHPPMGKLRIFSWLFIVFTLLTLFLNQESSGRYSDSAVLYLTWLISLCLASINLIILIWHLARLLSSEQKKIPAIYLLPIVIMVGVMFAAAIGYRNIASLFFFGVINSLIVLILAFLLLRISNEFFDALDEGKKPWQRKLRNIVGVEQGQAFPGVLWLRILLFFMIAAAVISLLMTIWGGSQQRFNSLFEELKDGINIGGVNLDLIHLIYALLILVGVFSILPFIKNQLVAGWLKHSNLSRGAREATQTLVGYAGVAIAILWALNVAGVNFQHLAIVAGALSVGIGFGLQNIVNNFVSGLILLFERPIRRGDWVVVGETEGYVKDISIRSTVIQTFERADVIVPNSELISNQVTNLVLSNTIGRLKAPVGVAYGSDVSQVMEILKEIANKHPDVISGFLDYPVHVLFRQFGDSSLDFELRCFVRDIDNRLLVLSDINQSIDEEFRKANIEIPFPQRDVNMRGALNVNSRKQP